MREQWRKVNHQSKVSVKVEYQKERERERERERDHPIQKCHVNYTHHFEAFLMFQIREFLQTFIHRVIQCEETPFFFRIVRHQLISLCMKGLFGFCENSCVIFVHLLINLKRVLQSGFKLSEN